MSKSRPVALLDLPQLPAGLRFRADRVADGRFDVEAGPQGGVIEIFDVIGDEGATASKVSAGLRRIGNKPVTVKVNSPGGDYFEGAAIYNLLRQHPAAVTVEVLGQAGSAASLVAVAADDIAMARNATMMVHRPWVVAVGNNDTMMDAARLLEKINVQLADTYAARTKQPTAKVAALMAAETTMTPGEAIALGFADRTLDRDAVPRPKASTEAHSRSQLISDLRQLGYAKAAARAIAASGWGGLGGSPANAGISALTTTIQAALAELEKERDQ